MLAVCDVDQWRRELSRRQANEQICRGETERHRTAAVRPTTTCASSGPPGHRRRGHRHRRPLAPLATVLAAKAGKDVYCEKPLSLTIREARAMVEAIRRYGRVFQGGLQQRSSPEFRRASALVQSGAIGKVQIVYVGLPGGQQRREPARPSRSPRGSTGTSGLGRHRGGRSTAGSTSTAVLRGSCPGTSAQPRRRQSHQQRRPLLRRGPVGSSAWTRAARWKSSRPKPGSIRR